MNAFGRKKEKKKRKKKEKPLNILSAKEKVI